MFLVGQKYFELLKFNEKYLSSEMQFHDKPHTTTNKSELRKDA